MMLDSLMMIAYLMTQIKTLIDYHYQRYQHQVKDVRVPENLQRAMAAEAEAARNARAKVIGIKMMMMPMMMLIMMTMVMMVMMMMMMMMTIIMIK